MTRLDRSPQFRGPAPLSTLGESGRRARSVLVGHRVQAVLGVRARGWTRACTPWAGRSSPRLPIRLGSSIPLGPAVGRHLSAHRRRRPSQRRRDHPQRAPGGQAAGDLLALLQPQARPSSSTELGANPTTAQQIRPHRAGVHNPISRASGFAACPARNRSHTASTASVVKPRIVAWPPEHLDPVESRKCCVDPLRPPACPVNNPGGPRPPRGGVMQPCNCHAPSTHLHSR